MTVGELRLALEDIPDDIVVTAYSPGDSSVGIFEASFGIITAGGKYDGEDSWFELLLED
jgi:hypothetical protein